MKILAICGSLQAESSNLSLLVRAGSLVPAGVEFEIFDGVRELPPFNPDIEGSGEGAPASVIRFREVISAADAVLIACPEYGHGMPGALKNALDWTVGSGEFNHKVVAVTASAAGPGRGEKGLASLCTTLNAIDARILGGEPIVRGAEADAELQALLEAMIEAKGA